MFTATTFYQICIGVLGAVSVRGDCWKTPDQNGLVVIPEGTDTIPAEAFARCAALKKINIPASVENIKSYAFYEASNLKRVFFKKGSLLEGIGERAFESCVSLMKINFPASLKGIGSLAFSNSGLKKIIFKEGIKVIGERVCYNCQELKKVILPASVEKIGASAFSHSYGLEKIIFKKGSKLETIGKAAFYGAGFYGSENLKTVILPPSVEEIGEEAFMLSGLEKVFFKKGSKLEYIGEAAFYGSENLKTINIPREVVIDWQAFYNTGCLEDIFTPGAKIVDCIAKTKGLRGN